MTTILRDSLGGNCKTVMIANMASDPEFIEETISTARFSERCGKLVNEVERSLYMAFKTDGNSNRLKKMKSSICTST